MNPVSRPAVRKPASRAAAVTGAVFLAVTFGLVEMLVFQLRGVGTASVTGALLGGFLGLVSLAVEIGMQERSARTFHAQGLQTTFLSFVMRVVVVAPLTILFMGGGLGIDHEAFALSYCATFLLYLCWLTWETYHAPAAYRPRAAAGGLRVVVQPRDGRAAVGSAR